MTVEERRIKKGIQDSTGMRTVQIRKEIVLKECVRAVGHARGRKRKSKRDIYDGRKVEVPTGAI